VNEWFPKTERAFAIGIFNSGSMIGSIVAPPLVVFLASRFGFRWAFAGPALLAAIWVPLWLRYYRRGNSDTAPQQYSSRELLHYRQAWAIMICRLLVGPIMQFYWYWMPDYLYTERGFSLMQIGAFSWIPFLMGDFGSLSGGWISGWLIRLNYSLSNARKITMYAGGVLCLTSFAVYFAPSAAICLAVIGVVLFGHTFLSANMFAAVPDMFPDSAVARVTGLHGMCGGLSGFLFPLLTGYLIDRFSYAPVFALAAIMPLAGVVALFQISRGLKAII
jgi:ACS family hexuronate transporter-like MFS transporter